jgi:hypothetical protein
VLPGLITAADFSHGRSDEASSGDSGDKRWKRWGWMKISGLAGFVSLPPPAIPPTVERSNSAMSVSLVSEMEKQPRHRHSSLIFRQLSTRIF